MQPLRPAVDPNRYSNVSAPESSNPHSTVSPGTLEATRLLLEEGTLPSVAKSRAALVDKDILTPLTEFAANAQHMLPAGLRQATASLTRDIAEAAPTRLADARLIAQMDLLKTTCQQRLIQVQNSRLAIPDEATQLEKSLSAVADCQRILSDRLLGDIPPLNVIAQLHSLSAIDYRAGTIKQQASSGPLLQQTLDKLSADSQLLASTFDNLAEHHPTLLGLASQMKQNMPLEEWLNESEKPLKSLAVHSQSADLRASAETLLVSIDRLRQSIIQLPDTADTGQPPTGQLEQNQRLGKKLLAQTDIYSALSGFDSKEYLSLMRGEFSELAQGWLDHNEKLEEILAHSGLPVKVQKDYMRHCNNMNATLKSILHGVPLKDRLKRGTATLLAYPLPLAVPLISGEKSYSSTLIPHFIKNACILMGLMQNDTTDKTVVWKHFDNRLYVNTVIAALFIGPTIADHVTHSHSGLATHIGLGTVAGAAIFSYFNQEQTKAICQKAIGCVFSNSSGNSLEINEDAKVQLREYIAGLDVQESQQNAISQQQQAKGKQNSDTLNMQLTHTASSRSALRAGLKQHLDSEATEEAELDLNLVHENIHELEKRGLTVLTGLICIGVVALMFPDAVGVVDYIIDGLWCVSEMYKEEKNPDVNLQKAIQTFKELVGLNLTMLIYLSFNKGLNFLDTPTGYAAGTAAMTAANLTMPGMVGNIAGTYAGKGISAGVASMAKGRAHLSKMTDMLSDAWGLRQDNEVDEVDLAERGLSPRITELPDDEEDNNPLTPPLPTHARMTRQP